jgi:ligand-binding SRPBCC domain-containing protein
MHNFTSSTSSPDQLRTHTITSQRRHFGSGSTSMISKEGLPDMRHLFHAEQWLPYPVDLVFVFFANPENLPRLMPAWQKTRIEETSLAPPPPIASEPSGLAAGAGTKLKISFRPFAYAPIRISWNAEISEFVWNNHFCDQQVRGPFAYWHHCHHVQPQRRTNDSGIPVFGTLLNDEVEYELPLGKLGDIADTIINWQLRKTFAYRHSRTLELLTVS